VINTQIQKLVKSGQFLQAIKLFESLPETINPVTQSAETSWAVAEAYRKLQQPLLSRDFYRKSASLTQTAVQKFRTIFWQLEMTQGALDIAIAKNPSSPETLRLRKDLTQTDQACLKLWSDLKEEEQKVTLTEFKPELEAGIESNSLTFTHPTLLLSAWNQTLGTQTSTTTSVDDPIRQIYLGDHTTVSLLSQLAKRFGQIGQESNRRAAQELLRYLNPSSMPNNSDATAIWTKELVDLAETYRRNNQYLEAGRLYILTGEKSPNWEGRAEALYKGGLLLYRSGRRDEAIKAFDQAANDGNNLLYAELAKKRLEQLKD
jgi:tetratricopeptide (TPR) repeat protein